MINYLLTSPVRCVLVRYRTLVYPRFSKFTFIVNCFPFSVFPFTDAGYT